MQSWVLGFILLFSSGTWALETYPKPKACSTAKIQSVLQARTKTATSVNVDCNLNLKPKDKVTKKIVVTTSGVTIDCHGASINGPKAELALNIDSKKISNNVLVQTRDVTVRNCLVNGGILVGGAIQDSSKNNPNRTAMNQATSPTRITLNHLTIKPNQIAAIHFMAGVTESSILNSNLGGESKGTAIYFSPESARNVIKNNVIETDTGGEKCFLFFCFSSDREVIALDGSAENLIIDNTIKRLHAGGIFLYRNCGEGGSVRIQTPSGNKIINNVFHYNGNNADNPAIWIGSRDGNRDFCKLDNEYNFGSGKDNRDFAKHNAVYQNQFQNVPVTGLIRAFDNGTSTYHVNTPNYIGDNNRRADNPEKRKAGCFMRNGYPEKFVTDGKKFATFLNEDTGLPECRGKEFVCDDGVLTEVAVNCPTPIAPEIVDLECRRENSNSICTKTVKCSGNRKIAAIKSVANIEYGEVSQNHFDNADWNLLTVTQAAGLKGGFASVGKTQITGGFASLAQYIGQKSVTLSCQDIDSNGGDCNIVVRLTCE